MLQWHKSFVDDIGYDKLQKFSGKLGGGDSEWSAAARLRDRQDRHDDRRRVANAFIEADKSKVNYATALVPGRRRPARPVRLRAGRRHHHRHPQGRQAPGRVVAAGQVHDDRDLGRWSRWPRACGTSPRRSSRPRTRSSTADEHFSTFMEIFKHPKSTYKTITTIGQVDEDLFGSLAEKYQAGKVTDLQAASVKLDDQIAKQLQLGLGGAAMATVAEPAAGRRRQGPCRRAPPPQAALGPAPPAGRARLPVAVDHRLQPFYVYPIAAEPVLLLHPVRHPQRPGLGRPRQLPLHVHRRRPFWPRSATPPGSSSSSSRSRSPSRSAPRPC